VKEENQIKDFQGERRKKEIVRQKTGSKSLVRSFEVLRDRRVPIRNVQLGTVRGELEPLVT